MVKNYRMKNVFRSVIVIGILFSLSSCKKKGCIDSTADNYDASAEVDDGSCSYTITPVTPTAPSYTNYCTYSVDGVAKVSQAYFFQTAFGNKQLQCYQGNAGTFPDFVLNIIEDKPVGTYTNGTSFDFGQNFQYLTGSTQSTDGFYGNGTTGSFTITAHDLTYDYVEGTFSGTLYNQIGDSVVITNGAFGLDY